MTSYEVFKIILNFRAKHCGCGIRLPICDKWERENRNPKSSIIFICNQLSNLSQTKEDIEFFVGLAHVKFGDPWENMKKFLEKNTPLSLKKELYLRTEQDNKSLDKLLKTSNMSLYDLFKSPPGGNSIATALLRNLLINPWCYVNHLNVVDGLKLKKDEVKTLRIVKEITHAKKQH